MNFHDRKTEFEELILVDAPIVDFRLLARRMRPDCVRRPQDVIAELAKNGPLRHESRELE